MAALTLYLTNTAVSTIWQELSESAPGSADSNPNAGWTVAKTAAGNYSAFRARTERAATTFGATVLPTAASLDSTNGDGFRTTNPYTGAFASANWTFTFEITAVGAGGSQDGNFGIRLYRSTNASGSGATEITSARQETSIVTNLATSATTELTLTFNPGAFSLTNEYLFVQVAWEITGVGGSNSCDVIFRIGANETRIVTSTFTPSFTGTGSAAVQSFAASSSGSEKFTGTSSAAVNKFAASASGTEKFTGSSSAAVNRFAASASGTEKFTSTASAALQSFAATSSGSVSFAGFTGSGSAAVNSFAASSSGTEKFTGTCSAAVQRFAATSSGSEKFTATAGAAVQSFAATSSGTVTSAGFSGSGSAALQRFAASSSGTEKFTGSASAAVQSFAGTAGGAERFSGTGSAAVQRFACASSGSEKFTSSGGAAVQRFACASVGAVANHVGSGSAALSRFASASSGTERFSGTSSAALSGFAAASSGTEKFTGSAGAAVQAFAVNGSGEPPPSGSGAAATQYFACSGTGGIYFDSEPGTVTLFERLTSAVLFREPRLVSTVNHGRYLTSSVTLRILSSMPFTVGSDIELAARFEEYDQLIDPTTVTVRIRDPNGTETSYVYNTDDEVERESIGEYVFHLLPTVSGSYFYRWIASGNITAAGEGFIKVDVSRFDSP